MPALTLREVGGDADITLNYKSASKTSGLTTNSLDGRRFITRAKVEVKGSSAADNRGPAGTSRFSC